MPSWRRSPKLSQSLVRRNAGTISQTKAIATYYESALVETALRLLLRSERKHKRLPPLLKFRSGGALVDFVDRDALYNAMEGK